MHDIDVSECFLAAQQNGLRIKTYQGGRGAVFNVKYRNIVMRDVANPIIITQVRCSDRSRYHNAIVLRNDSCAFCANGQEAA